MCLDAVKMNTARIGSNGVGLNRIFEDFMGVGLLGWGWGGNLCRHQMKAKAERHQSSAIHQSRFEVDPSKPGERQ